MSKLLKFGSNFGQIEGCGKTACLTALCKELGLHIEEWINPAEQVDFYGILEHYSISSV